MKRARYYRKDGTPIWSLLTWARLFENQTYKRVAETFLEDGTRISTVWLGLDHSFWEITGDINTPPLIFETMVFSPEKRQSEALPGHAFSEDWDQERYNTEAEAIAGHDAMVRKWKRIREAWKNAGLVPEDAPASYRSKSTNLN